MIANLSRYFGKWIVCWLAFAAVSGQEENGCEWAAVHSVSIEAREGVTRAFWRPAGSSSLAFVRLPHWRAPEVIRANATSKRDLHPSDPCHEVIVRASIRDDSAGRLTTTYTLEIPSLGARWTSSSSGRDAGTTRGDPRDPPVVTFLMTDESYWGDDCAWDTCNSRLSNAGGGISWCKWLLVADLVAIAAVLLMASFVLLVLLRRPKGSRASGFKSFPPSVLLAET
ncbi:uncharacterized protein LOC134764893 isoform X2 [Penaeus indicus]|uniref:uncharacterized protein LOC134764893 isoform X2 n=1 Tax=Penaeus indicus TaxID=29960 RepID=UPI00300D5D26